MNLINFRIRKRLKKNQFIYFLKVKLFNKDYRDNVKLLNKAQKTKEQIQKEMRMLEEYWHCQPLHYIRYALFDKDLTEEDLKDYIPPYYHYNYYSDPLFININKDIYDNKLSLYKIFVERGIPTPKVIAVVKNRQIFDISGNLIPISDFIKDNKEKLFFKPIYGAGGTGICVYSGNNFNLFINNLDKQITYVVQKAITQRYDISKINSSSVNTIRVVTQWRADKPTIAICVMRIGRQGKMVDNSHQGGLSIRVDSENGTFYPIATAEHGGGCIKVHPDSGFVFNGSKIDNWNIIRKFIINCAEKFPELKEIAWDVAITADGAEMIELNLGYGIDHLQCACGGMRRILNIYPNF